MVYKNNRKRPVWRSKKMLRVLNWILGVLIGTSILVNIGVLTYYYIKINLKSACGPVTWDTYIDCACVTDVYTGSIYDHKTVNPDGHTALPSEGPYLVPNYVHFIRFIKREFTYVEMIVVLAALKNQKPEKIFFHRNYNLTFTGRYWEILTKIKALMDIVEFKYLEMPEEVFGQKLNPNWRPFHASDLGRIRVLMEYGGIYLDNDSYLIKSLDRFRKYEMTLNWDEEQYLGTQVLVAHKDARFLKLWLETYRNGYRADLWYYNAGEKPTKEILYKCPDLIHRVKVLFGVDINLICKLYMQNWPHWRNMYAIHLWISGFVYLRNFSNKAIYPVVFNETNIAYYPVTFREMAYDVYEIGNVTWPKTKIDTDVKVN